MAMSDPGAQDADGVHTYPLTEFPKTKPPIDVGPGFPTDPKAYLDQEAPLVEAAGVMYVVGDQFLMTRRSPTSSDYPDAWDFPGGKLEPGETPEQAARREFEEETGRPLTGELQLLMSRTQDGCRFTTFAFKGDAVFAPQLSEEHSGFAWGSFQDLPYGTIHPGVLVTLTFLTSDELGIARLMRDGQVDSPQRYQNLWLYALRITGTGYAYRSAHEEFVFRDPSIYLNEDFLERCQGLSVILQHPEGLMMNTDDYKERVIGSIMLPYLQGNEVWGIAKIQDQVAGELMASRQLSTSPGVVFTDPDAVNSKLIMAGGDVLLYEGKPCLLDHLAVCPQGVWDKGGAPTGVKLTTTQGDLSMTDEEKARQDADKRLAKMDAVPEILDKVLACMDAMTKRMDGYDAKLDAMAAPMMDKAKKDAEEKAKMDAEEKVKMDAEEKAKMDKAKKDEEDEKAKKDAEEKEKAMMDKARKDAQAAVDVSIAARLAALEAAKPKPLSDADHAAFAEAQARGDQVYAMFGDSASRPLQGEDLLAYRMRLASGLKNHSQTYKDVDLAGIKDATLFGVVEKAIYADAAAAAMRPSEDVAILREVRSSDRAGRTISSFFGHPSSWMGQFRTVGRRVTKIVKDQAA